MNINAFKIIALTFLLMPLLSFGQIKNDQKNQDKPSVQVLYLPGPNKEMDEKNFNITVETLRKAGFSVKVGKSLTEGIYIYHKSVKNKADIPPSSGQAQKIIEDFIKKQTPSTGSQKSAGASKPSQPNVSPPREGYDNYSANEADEVFIYIQALWDQYGGKYSKIKDAKPNMAVDAPPPGLNTPIDFSKEYLQSATLTVCDSSGKDCKEIIVDLGKITTKLRTRDKSGAIIFKDFPLTMVNQIPDSQERSKIYKETLKSFLALKYRELNGKDPVFTKKISELANLVKNSNVNYKKLSSQEKRILDSALYLLTDGVSGKFTGTAVVLKCIPHKDAFDCYAITAAHNVSGVLVDDTTVEPFSSGSAIGKFKAELIKVDRNSDLALIRFTSSESLTSSTINASDKGVMIGQLATHAGCANNFRPPAFFGNRSESCTITKCDIESGDITCRPSIGQGSSGGGLFNKNGELIGIVGSGNPDENITNFIGSKKIIKFINESDGHGGENFNFILK